MRLLAQEMLLLRIDSTADLYSFSVRNIIAAWHAVAPTPTHLTSPRPTRVT